MERPAEDKPDRKPIGLSLSALIAGTACLGLVTYDLLHIFRGSDETGGIGYDSLAWLLQILAAAAPLLAVGGIIASAAYMKGKTDRYFGYMFSIVSLSISMFLGLPALIVFLFSLVDPH